MARRRKPQADTHTRTRAVPPFLPAGTEVRKHLRTRTLRDRLGHAAANRGPEQIVTGIEEAAARQSGRQTVRISGDFRSLEMPWSFTLAQPGILSVWPEVPEMRAHKSACTSESEPGLTTRAYPPERHPSPEPSEA